MENTRNEHQSGYVDQDQEGQQPKPDQAVIDAAKAAQDEKERKNRAEWEAVGTLCARKITDAENSFLTTKRDITFDAAKSIAGRIEAMDSFVKGLKDGFKEAGMSDGSIKVRVSEIRTVVLAYGRAPNMVQAHEGQWNSLVEFCRKINAEASGKKQGTGGKTQVRTVSSNRVDAIAETVETKADASQVGQVIHAGISNIAKHPNSDLFLLNTVILPTLRKMQETSKEEVVLKYVEQMIDLADELKARMQESSKAQEKGMQLSQEQSQQATDDKGQKQHSQSRETVAA